MRERYVGFDLGADTIRVVEYEVGEGVTRSWTRSHRGDVTRALREILADLDWGSVAGAVATGRMAGAVRLERVPQKAALVAAWPEAAPCAIVSIGAHGFSVTDVGADGRARARENARCSQGTGNFLAQLVDRFSLSLEEADRLATPVTDPAPLSGRCPVILKTDMTHLANHGGARERILAGLYDAVAENVETLIRPPGGSVGSRLVLIGGVARSRRVRAHVRAAVEHMGYEWMEVDPARGELLPAIGCARLAAARPAEAPLPTDDELVRRDEHVLFQRLPGLADAVQRVRRLEAPADAPLGAGRRVSLGFDIGSTGAKAVALDLETQALAWRAYLPTSGDPVGAARALAARFEAEGGQDAVVETIGVTGSGREIVGMLMASSLERERVFILNEIAAHAEGAVFYDPRVDTVFEIGGQDAKYIRLDGGRVVDAAMNEACSAGTGSFLEEQGTRFDGVPEVVTMGRLAVEARHGVSLGQHCSVFMAEIIEQAFAGGASRDAVLAGLYDAVVQNYLNRVKGTRDVGALVFCQGMPFASDALAAAVAARTGREVVVPPEPGVIGALGIARLADAQVSVDRTSGLDLSRFGAARVVRRDAFVCRSTSGCGGGGQRCRVQRLVTDLEGTRQRFSWGGSCSLYDRGAARGRLPDHAPDPFSEREALVDDLLTARRTADGAGQGRVAVTDEFSLKGLFPFFATFLDHLGFELQAHRRADRRALKRGVDVANVPYCAPMQLFHGVVADMLDGEPDWLFVPMIRELPRVDDEPTSVTCPVVQAAPDLVREAFFRSPRRTRLLAPVVDMAPGNLGSGSFEESCERLARELGAGEGAWRAALEAGRRAQARFDQACLHIGRRALDYAQAHRIPPVVVLGRAYTIYNDLLNSNVPRLLREQGALAIPVDCYPVDAEQPVFEDIFWHYSQQNLRAAHQIRRTDGVYSLFASNYSCGPDSFNLHFYHYIMEHEPSAVIETDGHSGDAGTRTRVEAFLHCVAEDQRLDEAARRDRPRNRFREIVLSRQGWEETRRRGDRILINPMGVAAFMTSAALRGEGVKAETLPTPNQEALALGRRHTSGKECVPMTITLGSLLQRLEEDRGGDESYAFVMPTAQGPCRFGVYNQLHKIVLERLGWSDRVRLISPSDEDYFAGLSPDFQLRLWAGMVAGDLLLAALHHVRPVERTPGAAEDVFRRAFEGLTRHLERPARRGLARDLIALRREAFGALPLVRDAARAFAAIPTADRTPPTVAVVGEIYVRLDPFANDFVIKRLERCGLRVRLAPFNEWIEYTAWTQRKRLADGRPAPGDVAWRVHAESLIMDEITTRLYDPMAEALGWGRRTTVADTLAAGADYVSQELIGEAVLTVGGPLHEYLAGEIDGVVNVGPLECMPTKIAESHFQRVEDDHGLPSLTLALNGDSLEQQALEDFAYEVVARGADRRAAARPPVRLHDLGRRALRGALMGPLGALGGLDAAIRGLGAGRRAREAIDAPFQAIADAARDREGLTATTPAARSGQEGTRGCSIYREDACQARPAENRS